MDRRSGHPDGRRDPARCQGSERHARSAGAAGGLFPRPDFCPRQRLSEELERRYRRQGQGRAGHCRNRGARPRPATLAGPRRPGQPAGQRQIVGSHPDAPQVADRIELRLDAGDRRTHRRPLQQERRGQFRPGQCRAARGARRLQEDIGAVRWCGDLARYRCRRADQRRRWLRPADVHDFGHQQAPCLCQRAAELRARDQDRRQGRHISAGISHPHLPGDGRGLLAIGRRRVRHHADAAWARQQQRRVDAGRLCRREAEPAARHRAAAHSRERADLQPERPARGDRRRRRQGGVQDRDHRARSRARHRTRLRSVGG